MNEITKQGLGIAFNESRLLGIEVGTQSRRAAITLAVLTLPPGGGRSPADSRISVRLSPIGRVVASFRHGLWNDATAQVEAFVLQDLLTIVQRFGGQPVYGWEFFDIANRDLQPWFRRLSLDATLGPDGHEHNVVFFQEGPIDGKLCHLDVCLWFRDIQIVDPAGKVLELNEVIEGGKRWWDAMYANDPRTRESGIEPLAPLPDSK